MRVRLREHLAIPAPFRHRDLSLIAAEEQVPERAQDATLGLESEVHGLERHTGRDRRDRGRRVAVLLEQALRRFEDVPSRGRRLRAAPGGVVGPALDTLCHSVILSHYSLSATCNESPEQERKA